MRDKINILLIEDNPGDARLLDIYLKESLGNEGYSLYTSEYLSQGLTCLANNTFNIIIIDLSLPDSSGLDTFKKVHECALQTPIIVLTGLDDESVGINALKLGAQDFLIKGKSDRWELIRSINYSIERHKLLKELSDNTKKLEEKTAALVREQLKLSEAQKLAHIGSWELDIINDTMNWSDEFYRIHGLNPNEFNPAAENFFDLIHFEDKDLVRKTIEESICNALSFDFQYRIIRPDKTIRIIHARGEIITDEQGKVVKLLGAGQDITDRFHEEELEQLVLAATQSYNSVIIINKNGKIEWVNEGFTKLTGFTLDNLKNAYGEFSGNKSDIFHRKSIYQSIIKNKKPIVYENRNFSKDGEEYWVITTLTPIIDSNGEVERIIAIDSDITLRKQMEEELVQANKIAERSLIKGSKALDDLLIAKNQLEISMKVKEQFLANMSHEIRTPMNAIVGFTDLILKTKLSPDQKQYIDAIKTSGRNLLVIINDILDFSKIQSGKIIFEQTELQLSQVISTLIELMLQKSVEKNIKLSSHIDKNIPDHLIGDPTRLNQILINLVGNAIKFTEQGEVKINVNLISETDDVINLDFSVSDTGIGIPKDKLWTVFEGFTQASNETTRKYGGTGLGLTIVKQLVELQGGAVFVTSEDGVGSTFSFNLKFKKDTSIRDKHVNSENEDNEKYIEGLNVLLVEDNLLNQILASKVLTDWNWNVDVADNGQIALEKLKKNNYDIVLMDIQMPEMDGIVATRQIRNSFSSPKKNIPILAMTAHALSGEADKCYEAGMNGYISKPFDEKVLYSRIISILKKDKKKEPENINNKMEATGKVTDLTYLKQLSKGSSEFIQKMITVFMDQTPEAVNNLEKHLNSKNWEALRGVAHKMKPSFSFLGIKEIEPVINDLEEYATQEINIDLLPGMISQIKMVCDKAMKELEIDRQQFLQ